jgi:hypothetical protein
MALDARAIGQEERSVVRVSVRSEYALSDELAAGAPVDSQNEAIKP